MRLLDRSRKGMIAAPGGQALLRRGEVAFDELRQGIAEIEFLSEPAAGEVKIECPELIATILPPIAEAVRVRYTRVVLDVTNVIFTTFAARLRDRSLDLVLMCRRRPDPRRANAANINVDVLFDDDLVVVGMRSPWARHSPIDLAELANEQRSFLLSRKVRAIRFWRMPSGPAASIPRIARQHVVDLSAAQPHRQRPLRHHSAAIGVPFLSRPVTSRTPLPKARLLSISMPRVSTLPIGRCVFLSVSSDIYAR
jgi:DNA-binding transcriptional LysR family regulator